MGNWVKHEQIVKVIGMMYNNPQHIFQLLTKNVPRLLDYYFPDNCHVLGSVPPDMMWGKELSRNQQERMLNKSLDVLGRVNAEVRGMSFEPLSWDVADIVADNEPLQWAIIGAASNGRKIYQPDPDHVYRLLKVLDEQNVPVFFKGNLWDNIAARPWREWFPGFIPSKYMGMKLGKDAMPIEKAVK
jgi:protein gp37